MDQITIYLSKHLWVLHVFAVVFVVLIANFIQHRALLKIHKRLARTSKIWDDALVDAARRPLSLLVWVVGLAFAAEIVASRTEATIFNVIDSVRDIGVVTCITWFLLRLSRRVEHNIITKQSDEDPVDQTTVDAIGKLVRLSFIITAALVLLQTLGYSISGVLAFGGIGGIAIGFAAKDLLANFFGGLMLYLDRPFIVGDWIRSPDREIEGTVEKIGWRLTTIRTFDKRPLFIPNSMFANISVENPSRMTNRRIYETIGIRYSDIKSMEKIVSDIKGMLLSHPEIDSGNTLMVNFNKFSESSSDFFVYCFTKTIDWQKFHEIKQEILLTISKIIENNNAEMAFPTSTIYLQNQDPQLEPERT